MEVESFWLRHRIPKNPDSVPSDNSVDSGVELEKSRPDSGGAESTDGDHVTGDVIEEDGAASRSARRPSVEGVRTEVVRENPFPSRFLQPMQTLPSQNPMRQQFRQQQQLLQQQTLTNITEEDERQCSPLFQHHQYHHQEKYQQRQEQQQQQHRQTATLSILQNHRPYSVDDSALPKPASGGLRPKSSHSHFIPTMPLFHSGSSQPPRPTHEHGSNVNQSNGMWTSVDSQSDIRFPSGQYMAHSSLRGDSAQLAGFRREGSHVNGPLVPVLDTSNNVQYLPLSSPVGFPGHAQLGIPGPLPVFFVGDSEQYRLSIPPHDHWQAAPRAGVTPNDPSTLQHLLSRGFELNRHGQINDSYLSNPPSPRSPRPESVPCVVEMKDLKPSGSSRHEHEPVSSPPQNSLLDSPSPVTGLPVTSFSQPPSFPQPLSPASPADPTSKADQADSDQPSSVQVQHSSEMAVGEPVKGHGLSPGKIGNGTIHDGAPRGDKRRPSQGERRKRSLSKESVRGKTKKSNKVFPGGKK